MKNSIKFAPGSRNDLSPSHGHRWQRLDFLLALALLFVGPQFASAQQSEGIEELYPMSDTILSIVFHPQMMIESASDQGPRDEFLQLAQERIGIGFREIQDITMRFGCDPQMGGSVDSRFVFSMQSDGDFDVKEFRSLFFRHFTFSEEEYNGQKLHLASNGGDFGPCLCAPDSNSLLLSTAPRIRVLLDKQRESVDFSNLLVELDGQSDLCGYINFNHDREKVREVVEKFFQGASFSGDRFIDAVLKINTGFFNVHLGEDHALNGTLETDSPDDARMVAEELTKTFTSIRDEFAEGKQQMHQMPQQVRDFFGPIADATIEILDNATATADGSQVQLRIEKTGGLAGALDQFIQAMCVGLNAFDNPAAEDK